MISNKEIEKVLRGTRYPCLKHLFTKVIYRAMTEPIPAGRYSHRFKSYEEFIATYNAIVKEQNEI
jgi:hypothetical protein